MYRCFLELQIGHNRIPDTLSGHVSPRTHVDRAMGQNLTFPSGLAIDHPGCRFRPAGTGSSVGLGGEEARFVSSFVRSFVSWFLGFLFVRALLSPGWEQKTNQRSKKRTKERKNEQTKERHPQVTLQSGSVEREFQYDCNC